ncbi:MAG TPA: hypothetical protein VHF26_17755, partial [Trebonia sp.]|nr:hypothetical protein [Trebonia sp.]
DLMLVHQWHPHQRPRMRMTGLPGAPRRSVFTATRTVIARTPAVRACRQTLASIVPPDLPLVSASDPGGADPG